MITVCKSNPSGVCMVLCSAGHAVLCTQWPSCTYQMLSTFWHGIHTVPLSGSVLMAPKCHIAPVGRVSRQLHHLALAPVLEVFIFLCLFCGYIDAQTEKGDGVV